MKKPIYLEKKEFNRFRIATITSLLCVCFLILFLFGYFSLQNKNKIPETECRIETHTEKLIYEYLYNNWSDGSRLFPIDSEIICEEGIRVEKYPSLGYQIVWGYDKGEENNGKICLVLTKKEICEVI